jgi:hypothetical protein
MNTKKFSIIRKTKYYLRNLVKLIKDFLFLRKPRLASSLAAKLIFKRSKNFHGKIRFRMAYDHNPLFVTFVDKLECRKYVESKIGSEYLPNLFFEGENLDLATFENLPTNVVIKVNHLSGGIILRHQDAPLYDFDLASVGPFPRILVPPRQLDFWRARGLTDSWLQSKYENATGSSFEWAYSNVKPRVFAEEFIESNPGSLATDFKFFVFRNLSPYFLTVEKQNGITSKKIFDKFGKRLKAFPKENFPDQESIEIDEKIIRMNELAITLADGIDHLRVDFYTLGEKIYVGELTPYDAGGVSFCTRKFERFAGEYWKPSWQQTVAT